MNETYIREKLNVLNTTCETEKCQMNWLQQAHRMKTSRTPEDVPTYKPLGVLMKDAETNCTTWVLNTQLIVILHASW